MSSSLASSGLTSSLSPQSSSSSSLKDKKEFLENIIQEICNKFKSQSYPQLIEHGFCAIALLYLTKKIFGGKGWKSNVIQAGLSTLKALPGGRTVLNSALESEAKKSALEMIKKRDDANDFISIPSKGYERERILKRLKDLKSLDVKVEQGNAFAYVYDAGHEHVQFTTEVHDLFIHTNALDPTAFQSLRTLETEIVRMGASMFHGDQQVVGSLSSGGTESIALAVKTYRDRARDLKCYEEPFEIVAANTVHPAFDKAAHNFGIRVVKVDCDPISMKLDVQALEKAITKRTILLVASAPSYPHGVMDPVEQVAALGEKRDIPVHVDSCIGGFILPWLEKLGYQVPLFDFRLKGVTSISADLHKYGYTPKYASLILYRNAQIRKYQFFVTVTWPGGVYISSTLLGTRGGGPIAAAWASLVRLGEEGFVKLAKECMDATQYFVSEVSKIEGLEIIGNPVGTIFAYKSNDPSLNILAVSDAMEQRGWHMCRQQNPHCIHSTVMPQHVRIKEKYIKDLKDSVAEVRASPKKFDNKGSVAMYGMMATVPDGTVLEDFLYSFMNYIYQ